VWETSGRLASEDPFSEPFLTTKVVPAEAFLEKQELTKQEVLSPGQKKSLRQAQNESPEFDSVHGQMILGSDNLANRGTEVAQQDVLPAESVSEPDPYDPKLSKKPRSIL
jgi:hypothetical protein